jgi:hypothetical protein
VSIIAHGAARVVFWAFGQKTIFYDSDVRC